MKRFVVTARKLCCFQFPLFSPTGTSGFAQPEEQYCKAVIPLLHECCAIFAFIISDIKEPTVDRELHTIMISVKTRASGENMYGNSAPHRLQYPSPVLYLMRKVAKLNYMCFLFLFGCLH